jgi:hypothetical protein
MNNNDRKELSKAISLLEAAKEIIESLNDSEQEKFNNLSERLQRSDKGQAIEAASNSLEYCLNSIDEAIEYAEEIE